jgi:hypothetical protein
MKALPPALRIAHPSAGSLCAAILLALFSSFSATLLRAESPRTADSKGAKADYTAPGFEIQSGYTELPGEHTTGALYIRITSINAYAGTVNLTCERTGGPNTATPAECTMYPDTATLTPDKVADPAPQILFFGVGTKLPAGTGGGDNTKLLVTGGGAVLACGLLIGIPARRKGWRGMIAAVLLLTAMGGLSACITTPKIVTHGTYYFRVTGVDSANSAINASGTIRLEVL